VRESFNLRRKGALFLSISATALLAGCGGGGEDDGFPIDLSSTFTDFYIASITNQWRADAAELRENAQYIFQDWVDENNIARNPIYSSRAEYAHALGLTGAGQVISIVDEGFRRTHEAFAGKDNSVTGSPGIDDHGTMVASIAAGDSATMVGIAPGADIAFGKAFDPGQPADFAALTAAANDAINRGAVAQNNSWGYDGVEATIGNYNAFLGGIAAQNWISALTEYAQTGVVVFAISNDANLQYSNLLEALPTLLPSLEAGWIAVGNATPIFGGGGITWSEGALSSVQMQSSACHEAGPWCIVADGDWFAAVSGADNLYATGLGSSFAAPQVSGALALLAEAFPNMTPHQLRARLLASANDDFAGFFNDGLVDLDAGVGEFWKGYSDIYGHGFLDIRAALLPIGSPTLLMANGETMETRDFAFATGGAMGDAVRRSLDGVDLAVSDELGGDFDIAAASFTSTATPGPLAAAVAARSFSKNYAATRTASVDTLEDVFAAHPGQTMELNAPDGQTRAAILMGGGENVGLAVTRTLTEGDLKLDLGLKVARDGGSVMGFSDAANSGGATMASVTLGLSHDVGNGGFFALSGEMGVADLGAPAALTSVSQAAFDSVSLDVGSRSVFARNDRLSLGVSMPVAVTSGSANMTVPVSLAAGGSEMRSVGIDLAPEERQVELSVSYQMPMSDTSELLLEVVRAENYGNRAGVTDNAAVIGMKWSF